MDRHRTLRALLTLAVIVAISYAAWSFLETSEVDAPSRANTSVLRVTILKDGDSWVASDGREYRLGMVNAPEPLEPCAREATRFTRHFLDDGFTADAYATDPHGRQVSEVFARTGASLNVALVQAGYSDDRYLNNFRHENPALARRLDDAFATAARPACLTR